MRIAIVGAGISGLAAAYDLQKDATYRVTLFEQSAKVGGKIQTAKEGDYLVEGGPDSIFSAKPWASELMAELGMEDELVEPLAHEFSILSKGKLHGVPRALASLIPSASGALEKAGFLSAAAKKRALKEAEVERSGGGDESIASFFRRRFGRTFAELVAEPLLAGTHAGDPEKLSMAALYPTYLGMERDHGSISQAAAARQSHAPTSHGPVRKAGFYTLRSGMAAFPQRLAAALDRTVVNLETTVDRIEKKEDRIVLHTSRGSFEFDHVILAVPAYAAAPMLRQVSPDAAQQLDTVRFVSTAIVSLAYPRTCFARPLVGNGFLVPRKEPSFINGCTWSSNKWAGRAPDDILLVRAFIGREGGVDIDAMADEELVEQAKSALGSLLEANGDPVYTRLDRWPRAMAQYEMGHLERLGRIQEALSNLPITLIGASYRGNSIPDCVRQGREAAAKLAERRPASLATS